MVKKLEKQALNEADEILARDQLAIEASYRARGRRLQHLTEQALIDIWIAYLRREYLELAEHRAGGSDISAELSIRGLQSVNLPDDVREAMQAEAARILVKYSVPSDKLGSFWQ